MSSPSDLTDRFLLENLDIRGQVVRLGPLWRTILARRDYPEAYRQLLGEFAAIAVLIGSGLKHPGRAVLQVMGHGPVSLAVADCTHDLALRAMLKIDEKKTLAAGGGEGPNIHDFFPTGRLVLTIENTQTARHFQSIVPLEGATLAECFERYFDRSEQVPTHLWVQATPESVGALILQKLPKADEKDPNGWARVQQQAARNAPHCLSTLSPGVPNLPGPTNGRGAGGEGDDVSSLLTVFFPHDDIRLFKAHPVKDGCSRSEEKVVAMLKGLGRTEVEAALAEQGVMKVHDEICNQEYRFTPADVARIFEG
ncbi:MAG: Hsp33 family molecular chaperone HslO [Betaproteobacteria bacterium]|nr:Hsp33 family molecular chaperone HslO [Betaproteobacteria bacterium]PWB67425.1 MAG: molecular chaperone Hsp33 [Betaproteobacteria bacterium]